MSFRASRLSRGVRGLGRIAQSDLTLAARPGWTHSVALRINVVLISGPMPWPSDLLAIFESKNEKIYHIYGANRSAEAGTRRARRCVECLTIPARGRLLPDPSYYWQLLRNARVRRSVHRVALRNRLPHPSRESEPPRTIIPQIFHERGWIVAMPSR